MNQFQIFILYEFAKEIQKNHSEKKIWIIEDNVSCHLATKYMTKHIQIKKRIEYVSHLANSSNLNEIELFWGEIKHIIISFDFKLSEAVALNICQKKINYILNHLNQSIVNEQCQHFKTLLTKCLKHKKNNNYHD